MSKNKEPLPWYVGPFLIILTFVGILGIVFLLRGLESSAITFIVLICYIFFLIPGVRWIYTRWKYTDNKFLIVLAYITKGVMIAILFAFLAGIILLLLHVNDKPNEITFFEQERMVYGRQLEINTYELIIFEKPNNLINFIYKERNKQIGDFRSNRYKVDLKEKWNFWGITAKKGTKEYQIDQVFCESDEFLWKDSFLPSTPKKESVSLAVGHNYIIYDGNEYIEHNYPQSAIDEFEFSRRNLYDNQNDSVL